jgi:hypothetical protein
MKMIQIKINIEKKKYSPIEMRVAINRFADKNTLFRLLSNLIDILCVCENVNESKKKRIFEEINRIYTRKLYKIQGS